MVDNIKVTCVILSENTTLEGHIITLKSKYAGFKVIFRQGNIIFFQYKTTLESTIIELIDGNGTIIAPCIFQLFIETAHYIFISDYKKNPKHYATVKLNRNQAPQTKRGNKEDDTEAAHIVSFELLNHLIKKLNQKISDEELKNIVIFLQQKENMRIKSAFGNQVIDRKHDKDIMNAVDTIESGNAVTLTQNAKKRLEQIIKQLKQFNPPSTLITYFLDVLEIVSISQSDQKQKIEYFIAKHGEINAKVQTIKAENAVKKAVTAKVNEKNAAKKAKTADAAAEKAKADAKKADAEKSEAKARAERAIRKKAAKTAEAENAAKAAKAANTKAKAKAAKAAEATEAKTIAETEAAKAAEAANRQIAKAVKAAKAAKK